MLSCLTYCIMDTLEEPIPFIIAENAAMYMPDMYF